MTRPGPKLPSLLTKDSLSSLECLLSSVMLQRAMQTELSELEWQNCFVYIDDILIASRTFKEHLGHLEEVIDCLKKANLRLKPKKCRFLSEKVS